MICYECHSRLYREVSDKPLASFNEQIMKPCASEHRPVKYVSDKVQ